MTCKATKYFVCIYDVFLCVAGCISCISRCCSWYLGVVPGTSVLFRVPRCCSGYLGVVPGTSVLFRVPRCCSGYLGVVPGTSCTSQGTSWTSQRISGYPRVPRLHLRVSSSNHSHMI